MDSIWYNSDLYLVEILKFYQSHHQRGWQVNCKQQNTYCYKSLMGKVSNMPSHTPTTNYSKDFFFIQEYMHSFKQYCNGCLSLSIRSLHGQPFAGRASNWQSNKLGCYITIYSPIVRSVVLRRRNQTIINLLGNVLFIMLPDWGSFPANGETVQRANTGHLYPIEHSDFSTPKSHTLRPGVYFTDSFKRHFTLAQCNV